MIFSFWQAWPDIIDYVGTSARVHKESLLEFGDIIRGELAEQIQHCAENMVERARRRSSALRFDVGDQVPPCVCNILPRPCQLALCMPCPACLVCASSCLPQPPTLLLQVFYIKPLGDKGPGRSSGPFSVAAVLRNNGGYEITNLDGTPVSRLDGTPAGTLVFWYVG